ncbi:hypothetical protein Acr_14g0010090 [Actinidia rufa]|uniref:UBN2_3 domain-containing protein n=1 Tax=Actinidia rufa TaxID=165716 RepID=A0A7J0FS29_9ERIC|nr:hypothetical protein Acr_14g0010090 [Actinidia rufa]
MEAEESTKVASPSHPPPPPPPSETLVSETESNLQEEEEGEVDRIGDSKSTSFDQKEILRALEVVERDSVAIAQSYTSLFASLRLALSENNPPITGIQPLVQSCSKSSDHTIIVIVSIRRPQNTKNSPKTSKHAPSRATQASACEIYSHTRTPEEEDDSCPTHHAPPRTLTHQIPPNTRPSHARTVFRHASATPASRIQSATSASVPRQQPAGDAQPPHFSDSAEDDDNSHAKYQSKLEDWDSDNAKIITWFSNTSISSIHSLFTPFETAKEIWDYLAERDSSVDDAGEYQLGLELHYLRFEPGQTLTDFYSKMSNLWNHLAQFEPTWSCSTDAAAFYVYRDRSRLRHFLMALPPDYEHTRASLFHRHPLPTLGQALAKLRSEETQRKTMIYHQHSQPVLATPSWTPLPPPSPSQSIRSTSASSKTIPSGSQKKYCSFCRHDNHSYEDCRSRNKNRRKGSYNRQTAAVINSTGSSPDSASTLTAADVETIVIQVLFSHLVYHLAPWTFPMLPRQRLRHPSLILLLVVPPE